VGATATVHRIVEEKETQVQFAPPPEPVPPPPPPEVAAPKSSPRPKVKRPELAPPDKISDEKLKESDKPLAAAGASGPVEGFLDGVAGGTGTAAAPPPPLTPPPPPPKIEPLVAPVELGHNDRPKYSVAARRKGIEGTVVVAFDVLEDGSVGGAQILSGPSELHDCVLRAVASWRFVPAHRGNEKVRFRKTQSIVFRLDDG
jgi:protein TonB